MTTEWPRLVGRYASWELAAKARKRRIVPGDRTLLWVIEDLGPEYDPYMFGLLIYPYYMEDKVRPDEVPAF